MDRVKAPVIIAKTMQPSFGKLLIIEGVAALLELGSGFNPDFSRRKNVYLNGSIIELSKVESIKSLMRLLSLLTLTTFLIVR